MTPVFVFHSNSLRSEPTRSRSDEANGFNHRTSTFHLPPCHRKAGRDGIVRSSSLGMFVRFPPGADRRISPLRHTGYLQKELQPERPSIQLRRGLDQAVMTAATSKELRRLRCGNKGQRPCYQHRSNEFAIHSTPFSALDCLDHRYHLREALGHAVRPCGDFGPAGCSLQFKQLREHLF